MAESSRQAVTSSSSGWASTSGNAQLPPVHQSFSYDQSSVSPNALFHKLVKLKKKVRFLKKRALIIQRDFRWLKDFDNSDLAARRILFYRAEFDARKDALEEAVTAHEYIQWHLDAALNDSNRAQYQNQHPMDICHQHSAQDGC